MARGRQSFLVPEQDRERPEFVLIDPVRNTRALLFDHARLAAAMSIAKDSSYDPNKLPFRSFKFTNDGKNEREIEFNASKKRFVCDIAAYRCTVSDTLQFGHSSVSPH